MTNEQVMKIMEELGLHEGGVDNWVTDNAWVKLAALVAAAEREALESLIEHIKNDWVMDSQMKVYAAEYLLSAIRARGQS
jgi:hypothetical protein